jgi:Uma2 family endonuclease
MAVEPAEHPQHAAVERWRFTVDDCYRMGEAGIFPPEARVELIDGDVIEMAPFASHHNGSVAALDEILRDRFGRRVTTISQGWLHIGGAGRRQANPRPDLLVLNRRDDFSRIANPTPADVLLVIEVSDTILAYDRDVKAPLYARAGIGDYWIVDLTGARLLVHRAPRDGVYRSVESLATGATVAPVTFPERTIAVADILA